MAWLAVDKNGQERIFPCSMKPIRCFDVWSLRVTHPALLTILPKGSIKKLIGRDLTWEDNPVELKEK